METARASKIRTVQHSVQTGLGLQKNAAPMQTVILAAAALLRLVLAASVSSLITLRARTRLQNCVGWRNVGEAKVGAVHSLVPITEGSSAVSAD
jgi:hypothetical protein